MPNIAIIGAGITGLSAAYALKKRGHSVTLIEKNSIPGGVIQTISEKNCLIELGPSTLQLNDSRILNLLQELNLDNQIIPTSPGAQKRFILKNNQLLPLPNSLKSFLTTPLFSIKAKLRLLKEPWIPKNIKNASPESLSQFFTRRLGQEILDYAVDPFVSGIYAGDPNKLSIQHAFPKLYNLESTHGSLFKAAFKKQKNPHKLKTQTITFQKGMATLPLKLAEHLKNDLHLNSTVTSISHTNNTWQLTWETQKSNQPSSPLSVSLSSTHSQNFTHLILTLPANQLSTLPFHNLSLLSQTLSPLQTIEYTPIAVLTQVFNRTAIKHPLDGFGMLLPSKENRNILGTLFTSSMFPNQTSSDFHVLRTFIGGTRFPIISNLDKKTIESIVSQELTKLLSISQEPIFSHVHQWNSAIPQYNLGYDQFFHTMENAEKLFPGLYIMGNFRTGISLPQCILAGLNSTELIN
ncbi:MAG: protoporphyrinogen oxidase [Verrucomicrobia bacterium]|nr:MAG: protoporphyrinogen oxidase [Verrucomicrobiota bacterium]